MLHNVLSNEYIPRCLANRNSLTNFHYSQNSKTQGTFNHGELLIYSFQEQGHRLKQVQIVASSKQIGFVSNFLFLKLTS